MSTCSSLSWNDDGIIPSASGWYAIKRADGSLCLRAYGNGGWWIPLLDGWLSGIPAGFKWLGPLERIEWDTSKGQDLGFHNGDVGWKLAMRVMEAGLYKELDEEERAVCNVIIERNPHIFTKRGTLRVKK